MGGAPEVDLRGLSGRWDHGPEVDGMREVEEGEGLGALRGDQMLWGADWEEEQ